MIKAKKIYRRGRKEKRHGATIVELVGMMGLLLVIGATTHRLLGNITRVSQESQMSRAGRLELERLAIRIRQDGRSATGVKFENETIKFISPHRQVHYQWKSGQPFILRQLLIDGKQSAVDRFRLRVGTTVYALVAETETDQTRLSVKLGRDGNANQFSGFLIEVET